MPEDGDSLVHEAMTKQVENIEDGLENNDAFFDDVGGVQLWRDLVMTLERKSSSRR